jgi:hypothetical protein
MPDVFNWGWGPAVGSILGFFLVIYLSHRWLGVDANEWRFALVWLVFWGPILAIGWRGLERPDR